MSTLREFLWILSMPCTEATRVISQSLDRRLPWRLRVAVRMHQWTCTSCRRFRRQIEALRSALARGLRASDAAADATLSPEARARLKARLRELSQD